MLKKIVLVVLAILLFSSFGLSVFAETEELHSDPVIEKAKVLEVNQLEEEVGFEFFEERLIVKLEILSGDYKGMQIETIHGITGNRGYDIIVEPGNKVLVTV